MRSPWIFQAGPTFNDKCPSQRWKGKETQIQGRGHVETEAEAGKTGPQAGTRGINSVQKRWGRIQPWCPPK